METKPTATLAKLYVSQEKYDYALAIYLYLQDKEGKDYQEQITEAVLEICKSRWGEYHKNVKKIFTKAEAAALHIIPEDLRVATVETLNDIENDFEGTMTEMTEVIEEIPVPEKIMEKIEEEPEEKPEEKPEIVPEPAEKEKLSSEVSVKDIEESIPKDDLPEIDVDEEDIIDEEIEFPSLGDEVYVEPEIEIPDPVKVNVSDEEDLVPGLEDFTSNYKKDVKQGLTEENNVSGDEKVEKKLQDDMDQKLFNVLRIMRGMSAEELSRVLKNKMQDGKKLEELTLADLEELID
ncbi:MAG: hypothetical protein RAO94_12400 [Candidatus Stygibacter australis]|nr:hypothetical protein [Candidatus Stygibacter australis]MDP8323141.1 hypothetical protein [Candidatus Stygibacter australis]